MVITMIQDMHYLDASECVKRLLAEIVFNIDGWKLTRIGDQNERSHKPEKFEICNGNGFFRINRVARTRRSECSLVSCDFVIGREIRNGTRR